jgi:hypothetical protein
MWCYIMNYSGVVHFKYLLTSAALFAPINHPKSKHGTDASAAASCEVRKSKICGSYLGINFEEKMHPSHSNCCNSEWHCHIA